MSSFPYFCVYAFTKFSLLVTEEIRETISADCDDSDLHFWHIIHFVLHSADTTAPLYFLIFLMFLYLTFVFCIYFLNRLFCRLCCYRFPMEMFSPFSPLNAPAIFASSCASSHLLDAAKSLSSFNKCGCSIG